MTKSIIFIGKWDQNLFLLENKIIKLQENGEPDAIQNLGQPDIKKYKINGFNCNAWVIVNDVKPILLLKKLISETKIVIFVFNLTNKESLPFLLEDWGIVLANVDICSLENQERILIGTRSKIDDIDIYDDEQICAAMEKFKCNLYCEDIFSAKNEIKNKTGQSYKIFSLREIIDHLKGELAKHQEENNSFKFQVKCIQEREYTDLKITKSTENDDSLVTKSDSFSVVYKLSLETHTADVIKSPKATNEITIPKSINFEGTEFIVKNICDYAFSNSSITVLRFPFDSKIEKIGKFAFYNSKLETLFIPKSLTELSEYWNGGAENLSHISVNGNSRYFDFEGIIYSSIQLDTRNTKLSTFKIHFVRRDLVDFIVDHNFSCIDSFVFYKCTNLKSFIFENPLSKVIEIGDYCFNESKNLLSVSFASEELKIGKKCFKNCASLYAVSFLNMINARFLSKAFIGCSNLTKIEITSSSSLYIGDCCFRGIENLQYLSLTTAELSIGDYCFQNCKSLSKIYFNYTKNTTIGKNAFEGCKLLDSLNLVSSSSIIIGPYCFNKTNLKSINLYCIDNLILGDFCFNKCSSLKSIYFKKPLRAKNPIKNMIIGNNCFEGCISLTEIKFINIKNLTMRKQILKGCKVNNISFKEGNSIKLYDESFFNLENLKEVCIETNQDLTISSNAFKECPNLIDIDFRTRSSLTIMENNFLNLGYLEIINLSGKKIVIKDGCFNNCINIKKGNNYINQLILFSDSIEIGNNCFNNLFLLNSINIDGKRLIIKNQCFNNCYTLSSLSIINSIETSIGYFSFNNLQNLSEVEFKNIYYIEIYSNSFLECHNIKKFAINFKNNSKKIIKTGLQLNVDGYLYNTFNAQKCLKEDFFIIKIMSPKYINEIPPFAFFKQLTSLMEVDSFAVLPYTGFGFMNYKGYFCPVIFREYVPYNHLGEIFTEQIQLPGTQRYIILLGVTFGMKYLHSLKINHSHLTPSNILIDEHYYPLISDFCLYNQKDVFSFKKDVHSYSVIAYILITGEYPLNNNFLENIYSNLGNINDPKIQELFKRIWLFDSSFIPPFDDIFDEILSDRYKRIFNLNEQEVSKYLKLIEKQEVNAKKQQLDELEKETIIESNENIVYKLNNTNYTAEIIESPKVSGDVFIPKYFEFKLQKYKIIRVSQKAFANSSIKSLSFSLNSFVESIGDCAFEQSQLQKLLIPNSLKKLDKYWNWCAFDLSQIEIDPENKNFVDLNGVIYYTENSQLIEIVFASPNIEGQFVLPESVTRIGCFSFNKCNKLKCVGSKSKSLEIDSCSFYFCNILEYIILSQEEQLSIEVNSFYEMHNLRALELKSPNLILNDNFVNKCPLEFISIKQGNQLTISPNTFKKCESIKSIKFISDSSITFTDESFNLPKLESIICGGDNVNIGNKCFASSKNLQSIQIHDKQIIKIMPETFYGFDFLTSIDLISDSVIVIASNSFRNCIHLNKIALTSTSVIQMLNNCFSGSGKIQSITIKSKDVLLDNNCFYNCVNLQSILFENVEKAQIGQYAFNGCNSLQKFSISVSSDLSIYDYGFAGVFYLNTVKLDCDTLNLGNFLFNQSSYIRDITIQCSEKNSKIGQYSFLGMNMRPQINFYKK